MVPRPQQSTGLLVLAFTLPLVFTLVGEGVNALVAAGVAVCVVDDHVVRGNGQVNPQLVAGQAALGLGTQRRSLVSGWSRALLLETQSAQLLLEPFGASDWTFWELILELLQAGEKTSA